MHNFPKYLSFLLIDVARKCIEILLPRKKDQRSTVDHLLAESDCISFSFLSSLERLYYKRRRGDSVLGCCEGRKEEGREKGREERKRKRRGRGRRSLQGRLRE